MKTQTKRTIKARTVMDKGGEKKIEGSLEYAASLEKEVVPETQESQKGNEDNEYFAKFAARGFDDGLNPPMTQLISSNKEKDIFSREKQGLFTSNSSSKNPVPNISSSGVSFAAINNPNNIPAGVFSHGSPPRTEIKQRFSDMQRRFESNLLGTNQNKNRQNQQGQTLSNQAGKADQDKKDAVEREKRKLNQTMSYRDNNKDNYRDDSDEEDSDCVIWDRTNPLLVPMVTPQKRPKVQIPNAPRRKTSEIPLTQPSPQEPIELPSLSSKQLFVEAVKDCLQSAAKELDQTFKIGKITITLEDISMQKNK
mgnify:CR=1 FL=1